MAVGLCYLARMHDLEFKFIHSAGFDMREYLAPNRIPWSAELSDISDSPFRKKELRYLAPYTDLPKFRKDRQYVCRRYIGNNILEKWDVSEENRKNAGMIIHSICAVEELPLPRLYVYSVLRNIGVSYTIHIENTLQVKAKGLNSDEQ